MNFFKNTILFSCFGEKYRFSVIQEICNQKPGVAKQQLHALQKHVVVIKPRQKNYRNHIRNRSRFQPHYRPLVMAVELREFVEFFLPVHY